ncbi:WD40 domain-containing protein [Streptomyces sp. NBC_01205]|nr:WD40 domain-containing protein [Streptomyces sp. NBC_01205]
MGRGRERPAGRAADRAHDAGRDVLFAPDGHTLVSAGRDDTVRLWETDPVRLLPPPCAATAGPHDRELSQRHVPGTPYTPGCG